MSNGEIPPAPRPGLNRHVTYRSKTAAYDLAAIIVATEETLDPKGVELGHAPPLSGNYHVHLVVLTPGIQGTAREGNEPNPTIGGGTYQEWDIPMADPSHSADGQPQPGSWRWPERV